LKKWNSFSVSEQEKFIGRTKKESRELQPLPKGSHVERTEQDKFGFVVRQR
jgi:deferrochelatase/peroxidase EfeB